MAHFLYVLDVPEEKVKHQVYPLQQDSQAMKEAKFMPRGFKIRYLRTFFFLFAFTQVGTILSSSALIIVFSFMCQTKPILTFHGSSFIHATARNSCTEK